MWQKINKCVRAMGNKLVFLFWPDNNYAIMVSYENSLPWQCGPKYTQTETVNGGTYNSFLIVGVIRLFPTAFSIMQGVHRCKVLLFQLHSKKVPRHF